MALIIQKFGGTSVGNLERIQNVAKIVSKTKAQGHDVVVVVSAMHGETDRLINLAHATMPDPHPREYDVLVSTGEQVSAALLSMSLIAENYSARSYTGTQAQIKTSSQHKKAAITEINTQAILADLSEGAIPVIAGFQGVDDIGQVTTFGRGGSDITAVALAAALKADECQVYTDVEGVYTSDPRVVKEARRLPRITFEEMLELASLGAKVLQIQAVELAHKHSVPLRVLSSFEEGPGTLITFNEGDLDSPLVSGIAFDRNQAKLTILGIPNRSGAVSHVLAAISDAGIEVDMIVQNIPSREDYVDFSFTVHLDDYKEALSLSKQVSKDFSARDVLGDDRIAKLSLVGVGMKSHAGVASKMLQALDEEGIAIHLITSSEVKISVVIDEKYTELGARTLHARFDLALTDKDPS